VTSQAVGNSGESGRWLAQRRFPIAVGIAIAEGLLVLVSDDWSTWAAVIVAVPIILFYILAGRTIASDTGRQVAWIAGASQAMTIVLVVLWLVLEFLLIAALIALAALAFVFLYSDRPGRPAKQ
jgi:hypothetical protein